MTRTSPTGRTFLADCEIQALEFWQKENLSAERGDGIIVTDFSSLEDRVLAHHLKTFIYLESTFCGPRPERRPAANTKYGHPYGKHPLAKALQ